MIEVNSSKILKECHKRSQASFDIGVRYGFKSFLQHSDVIQAGQTKLRLTDQRRDIQLNLVLLI